MTCYAICGACNGTGLNEHDNPCEFCDGQGEVAAPDPDAEDDECPTD